MFNFEPVLAAFKLKPLFLTGSVLELETDWTVRYNSKRFSHHLEVFMSDLNPNEFYFGFSYDLASGSADMTKRVFYDPSDLTTHAVITGMTGSGKTGMGIILLEEAALQGIPAILIDPKGDLTNHLLHFPNLLPEDFKPWVDAEAARREEKTVDQAAADAAASWSKGLAGAGIDKVRMEALASKVDYAIYTPGSDSGIPVSILASLKAPKIDWEENTELLREAISSTVTALLELVGFKNIDPVRSREHILLANIFENYWSQGKDLDLESLILSVQNPPFDKLGVFPVSKFFPEKERFDLAMLLNNFLAAPAFGSWLQGQPLDIGSILYAPDGKPRHSVFYLAHLADSERMFFVTLLYSAIETWMRAQSGTSNLRALVYFDEIVGYLPPIANPPSKPIILRMLKQARAFGVGLALSTQNPIDLDYKALSNAGTWIIGKLQTDQDKNRLLDGLDSLAGGYDRPYFDKTISALGKRVFLLHNVHAKRPEIFTTRWAMNYLPGPIMRNRLEELNRMVGADVALTAAAISGAAGAPVSAGEVTSSKQNLPGSSSEPALASRVRVNYLPVELGFNEAMQQTRMQIPGSGENAEIYYQPALMGQATVYINNRTYNVDARNTLAVRVPQQEGRGLLRWQDYYVRPANLGNLETRPQANASFGDLGYPFDDEKTIADMQKDFVDFLYRNLPLTIYTSKSAKMSSNPGESQESFLARAAQAGSGSNQAAAEKIKAKYEKQRASINTKLMKEELELDKDQSTLNQRKMEEAGSWLSTAAKTITGSSRGGILGKLTRGGSGVNSSLSKRRMTSTAAANVEESKQMIALYKQQLEDLDRLEAEDLEKLSQESATITDLQTVTLNPQKKDIVVDSFGLLWLPNYAIRSGDQWLFVPAYKE